MGAECVSAGTVLASDVRLRRATSLGVSTEVAKSAEPAASAHIHKNNDFPALQSLWNQQLNIVRPPTWRHAVRQPLLALVKSETAWMRHLQQTYRTPLLDRIFIWASFLGTHTIFLVGLPILFWFDPGNCVSKPDADGIVCDTDADKKAWEFAAWMHVFGRSMVILLALGCYFTGTLKDYLFLPRPPSPEIVKVQPARLSSPIHGSKVHEEFGFPSTHSTTSFAISAFSMWFFLSLHPAAAEADHWARWTALWVLAPLQVTLVMASRIYCGFHTATDVTGGLAVGAALFGGWVKWTLGVDPGAPVWRLERYFSNAGWEAPYLFILLLPVLISLHTPPHPACPCFDDSLSFLAVMVGVVSGAWYTGGMAGAGIFPPGGIGAATVKPIHVLRPGVEIVTGWSDVATGVGLWGAKVASGLVAIILWRQAARAVLRRVLPRLFDLLSISPSPTTPTTPSTPTTPPGTPPFRPATPPSSDPADPYPPVPSARVWTAENVARVIVYAGIAWIAEVSVPLAWRGVGKSPLPV
ncbi:hypothetical protein M427DRAFT_143753 [Gonapodya prolifera JEL478]|uniref:Phosphatidic acid phosphatase type 2/haloperoxidase domain-containing protein n=1 Tax=Gonapodya prolifera (strain JEL478) TaxID=1344416 RepID=A0A139APR8_GONPJ|nr:hypothetical protein M427DRAFT_143753 [Gonapodya prolifera JEL478]|eukprot:KXS18722.1 hypothetical protein M427DRAFT_143753 [Gonapodya prolifera JEL478]